MSEHVKAELTGGILVLTLQRPEKKNALTGAMYDALSDNLERAETDSAIKVVLFQGDGDSFTAGNDLGDFAAQANGRNSEESPAFRFIGNLGKMTKPLIAAVQGNAVGIGVGQRPKHEPVDHAEDCGVDADAKCQGEDDCEREARRAVHLPHRKAQVLR